MFNKEKILEDYPWYDYSYLFDLMILWFDAHHKGQMESGISVNNEKYAKVAKTMSELLKRIREDQYSGKSLFMNNVESEHTFTKLKSGLGSQMHTTYSPDRQTFHAQFYKAREHDRMQKEQDKAYFCKLFMKHIERLWD